MQGLRDLFRSTAEKLQLARPQLFPVDRSDLETLERNLKPGRNYERIADIDERAPILLAETATRLKEFAGSTQHPQRPGLERFATALDDFAWTLYERRFGQNDAERNFVPKAAVKALFTLAPVLGSVIEHELSNYDFRQHVVSDLPQFRKSLREFSALALNLNNFAQERALRVNLFESNADFIEEMAAACFPDIGIEQKGAASAAAPRTIEMVRAL